MVTIAEVARLAGCSLNTVSRALNDKPDVNPDTRDRILEIARRVGYVPNGAARSLAAGRTRTIGVVITELTVPAFGTLLDAVERVCREAGYTVLLTSSRRDLAQEEVAVRVLREHGVDGIMMTPVQTQSEHLRALAASKTPVVFMLRDVEEFHFDFACVDAYRSSYIGTSHLIGLGHRQIGYISDKLIHTQAHNRLAGYLAALEEHGIPRDDRLIRLQMNSTFDVGTAYRLAGELAHGPVPFTGLLLYSSHAALGVVRALEEAGLRVPHDVALVGQGTWDETTYLHAPLTYMHHPIADVGVRAAELLLRRIADPHDAEPQKIILQPELVIRESCGAKLGVRGPAVQEVAGVASAG